MSMSYRYLGLLAVLLLACQILFAEETPLQLDYESAFNRTDDVPDWQPPTWEKKLVRYKKELEQLRAKAQKRPGDDIDAACRDKESRILYLEDRLARVKAGTPFREGLKRGIRIHTEKSYTVGWTELTVKVGDTAVVDKLTGRNSFRARITYSAPDGGNDQLSTPTLTHSSDDIDTRESELVFRDAVSHRVVMVGGKPELIMVTDAKGGMFVIRIAYRARENGTYPAALIERDEPLRPRVFPEIEHPRRPANITQTPSP